MSNHPIVHIELSTRDRVVDAGFYNKLFGWEFEQMPEMNYATFSAEGGPGGGLNPVNENYQAGSVVVYVETEDINATLAKVEQLGGKSLMPPQEIPDVGWIALFRDLTGNMVGLLEPKMGNP
jgi:predicted enzyme related to lactoylglutathione lyase